MSSDVRDQRQSASSSAYTIERSARERAAFFGATSLAARVSDPLRAEPRFASLIRTINLDPATLTSPRGGRPR